MVYFLHGNPDSQNWQGLLEGNREAFVQLYNSYFNMLYEYGLRLLHDSETVKDCIQDLFVKLWCNRDRLTATPAVKAYLFAALRNTLFNKMEKEQSVRKRARKAGEEAAFKLNYRMDTPLIEDEEERYRRMAIMKALDQLSPRQKECIYLRFYSGLEYTQIAEMMDISLKATYKTAGRAISTLRTYLKETMTYSIALFTFMPSFF